jgi:hypothetical protein
VNQHRIDFELRAQQAFAYLKSLEKARDSSWIEMEGLAKDVPSTLVLCHPGWVGGIAAAPNGLGLTRFLGRSMPGRCASRRIWGYDCPLREEAVESDHLFPRALGGPGVATNQIWLCRLHNAWKSSDLTLFPWETPRPHWLDEQVHRMRDLAAGSSRLEI